MQLLIILSTSFVAVSSVALPPINLGYFDYPHGNQFVAWTPFTPATTQELTEVADLLGAIKGTATWTAIRTVNTYITDPICRNPFNITDDATNSTYLNLELACVDDNIPLWAQPEVTAVVDRTTNKTVETCIRVTKDGGEWFAESTRYQGSSLVYAFACSKPDASA
ncbi:hypothetical protein ColTof4_07150 [Colletotrichum tofieldiae]|uniref:Uncharacterized protein n=1 Tax=Colletotrichum tofieldiae TaxID=708197 RepID=A0A166VZU4_9PEZI|nr:hypothetical protein CT0861_04320 [Colletotrichum tofieldiae]GKT64753.1 hypothetical protein ColTof3_12092 [Colletotrichum tofieldiae]GKT74727.1 hypothetical protein ColTof4_07150 [Colletotrichum tofieldiae]GKT91916.1 hypothetical protein Ct61P_09766 [Colletotrichum tofieldiae]